MLTSVYGFREEVKNKSILHLSAGNKIGEFSLQNDPCCCDLCGGSTCNGNCCGCDSTNCFACTNGVNCGSSLGECGCFKVKNLKLINQEGVIAYFEHSRPIKGVLFKNRKNEDDEIWFSLDHVLLMSDCETETTAHKVKIGDILCSGYTVGSISQKNETNSYNFLTNNGLIKLDFITFTDKHREITNYWDILNYNLEHIKYKVHKLFGSKSIYYD